MNTLEHFKHWSDVPADLWRWPNFSPEEIACRGTGQLIINADALDKLQALRDLLGVPIIINSGYRSPEHNRAVGGAAKSGHLKGLAFDISMQNLDPAEFEVAARAVGFTGFGFYRRNNFIHVDTGPAREWGKRWATQPPEPGKPAPRFSPPPSLAPERLRDDATARGATVVAGGNITVIGALVAGLGSLSPVAQTIAVGGALALSVGVIIIARDKLQEWL